MIINGKKGKIFILLLIAAVGVLVSFVLWQMAFNQQKGSIQSEFTDAASYRYNIIENALNESIESLEAFGDFYASSQTVEEAAFESFSKGVFQRNPHIFEIRWIEKVNKNQRQVFEESKRKSDNVNFQIEELDNKGAFVKAGSRPAYYPVVYNSVSEEHRPKHQPVLGLDVASIPERWQAMQVAMDTASPATTGLTKQYGEKEFGKIMRLFLPIYKNNAPHNSIAERRENLLGFVSVLFSFEDMVQRYMKNIPFVGVDMVFYEATGSGKDFFYFRPAKTRTKPIEYSQLKNTNGISWSQSLRVANKELIIACTPSPEFLAKHRIILPWIVLFMGFFLTFILMAYLNAVIDRTKQIETLVVQRTEELKAANEFNEKILKTIPFPMDIVDEKGSILFMSEKFKSVVGVDCTAKRCWEIYRDDKKQCPDCPLRKGIKVGETATIEANGVLGKRVFLITHTGIIFQGKTAVLELFYDITEYRKTEDKVRRLSLVVEEGPTAVIIVDNEGNIEYVNPKFSSMTQYASKEVLGKNPRILKSGEHSEEFYKNLWDTIKSGKEWHGQLHNKKKSGELYWESASISPLRDSKGEITNFIAIKEDITELKNVENDLKIAGEKLEKEAADLARANEELKKIDQMKSEFTSMVSHELRTPLAAIKEGIAIVLDGTAGNINEKQKEFLELGKRNVDRLSRLINNILDFQKLESAKVLLNIVDNDINEAVLEVEATMKPLAKEKELVLVSETEKGLPKIKFDRDKIIQVLTNLANNAIKFTQKGTITIKTERAKEVVKISVIDTGSGIKEEDLSKLFQPFVQLEKGPDKTSGGTGLGLAICREIINRHKGKIWAESKPGKGSVFVFVLPVVERRS